MAKCINISHVEYQELLRKSNLDSATLSAKMGVWMEENNTDEWPSLEQLGLQPLGKELGLINPDNKYETITVRSKDTQKESLLNKYNIERVKDHYFYVLTKKQQENVDKYLKASRGKGIIGGALKGYTISDNNKGTVTYKIERGRGYLFIDVKEFVEEEGVLLPSLIRSIKIPVDLVYNNERSEYLAAQKANNLYIPHFQREINKELLRIKGISSKKSANYALLQFKSILVNTINKYTDTPVTYEDFSSMSEEKSKSILDSINLPNMLSEIKSQFEKYLDSLDPQQLKSEIIDLYKSHFDEDSLLHFEKLLDFLPSNFLKLITFNLVDLETAFFSGTSKMNTTKFSELLKLGSLVNMKQALGLNVALRNMYDDGIISQEELNKVNEVLKPQIEVYLSLKKKDSDLAFCFKPFIIRKSKTLKIVLGSNTYDALLNYWENSTDDIYNEMNSQNKGLNDLVSFLSNNIKPYNSVFTTITLGKITESRRPNSFKVDNLTIALHELGHALDMYMHSTEEGVRNRMSINNFLNELIETVEFKEYLEKGLKSRGYTVSNEKEIVADLFAYVIGRAVNYDLTKGHLSSLDAFFKDNVSLINSISDKHFNVNYYTTEFKKEKLDINKDHKIVSFIKELLNNLIDIVNSLIGKNVYNKIQRNTVGIEIDQKIEKYNLGNLFSHLEQIITSEDNFSLDNILKSENQEGFFTSNLINEEVQYPDPNKVNPFGHTANKIYSPTEVSDFAKNLKQWNAKNEIKYKYVPRETGSNSYKLNLIQLTFPKQSKKEDPSGPTQLSLFKKERSTETLGMGSEMNRQVLAALKDDQRILQEALTLGDGSEGSLEAILDYLESNLSTIPPTLRKFLELAKTALKSKPNVRIPVKTISIAQIPNELFKTDERLEVVTAYYNPNDGVIYLVEENIVNGLVTLEAGFNHDPFSSRGRDVFNDPRLKMLKTYDGNIVEKLIESVLHEVTHGWLLSVVDNPQTIREKRFVKDIKAFLESYKKQEGVDLTWYGFSDEGSPREFIAEIMTNHAFINHIKALDKANKTGFWNSIVQFISRLLGGVNYNRQHEKIVKRILDFTSYQIKSGRDFKVGNDGKAVPKVQDLKNVIKKGDITSTKEAFKLMKESVEFDEDAHTYTDKETGDKLTSVTTRITNARFGRAPEDEMNEAMSRGASLGKTTHKNVESLLSSVSKDFESELEFIMSKETKTKLLGILKEKLPHEKGMEYLSEAFVVDYEGEAAGQIDIVVLRPDGTIHSIWDVKTKEKGFSYWDKPFVDKKANTTDINAPGYRKPYSDRQRAHLQLSSYRRMTHRTAGLWADSMNVLMLKHTVDGNTITDIEVDTSFNSTGVDAFVSDSPDTNAIVPPLTIHSTGYKRKRSQFDDPKSKSLDEDETLKRVLTESIQPDGVLDDIFSKLMISLKHKRDIAERTGQHTKLAKADAFINKLLKEENKNIAILEILKQIEKSGNEALREYNKLRANKERVPSYLLLKWLELVSGYESINQYKSYLLVEGAALDQATIDSMNKHLHNAINKMDRLTYIFKKEAMENTIDALEPYFNRLRAQFRLEARKAYRSMDQATKDKLKVSEEEYVELKVSENDNSITYRTRETIRGELKRASNDINALYRWIDNVMDSKDPVIAATVKSFAVRHEVSRLAAIEKKIEVAEILRRVEEFQGNSMFGDMADFYSFMLEKEDGKNTGYITRKFKSKMFEDYNVIVDLTRGMEEDEKKAIRKAWKDGLVSFAYTDRDLYDFVYDFILDQKKLDNKEGWTREVLSQFSNAGNAPLDYKALQKNFLNYVEELYQNDKITKKELTEITYNESRKAHEKFELQELVEKNAISELTSDLLIGWFIENTWEYRSPIGKYYNPQWEGLSAILENEKDPRGDFYRLIASMDKEAGSFLPHKSRLRGRLPGVVKQFNERLKEGQSVGTIFKQSLLHGLTLRPEDVERGSEQLTDEQGKPKYFLPIHYTVKLTEEDQSYDLATIYFKYWEMAKDYHEKIKILPDLELAKWHIDNRETIVKDRFGKNLIKKFKGEKENFNSFAVTDKSNLADQFNDWFLSMVYGKRQVEGATVKVFGKEVNIDKLLDLISNYSAINLLGMNFIQGTANVVLGESLQKIEVFAKQYVNMKSYWEADKYYTSHLMGMISDWGRRTKKNVASLILEESGVLNDGVGTDMRQSTKFRQLANTSTLFVTSYAGEHWMQGRFLFAMMKDVKAKDKDGNTLAGSILDYYRVNKEGKLEIMDVVDLEKSKWTKEDRILFNLKVKGILSRIHGAYGDLERVAIQRFALGRMAYQMRKFVIPGFKRRWEKYDYSERMEDFTEGNYRTFGRFISQNIKELSALKFSIMKENWKELTDMEKANIKRTIGEIAFLTAAIVISRVLMAALKDADDDNEERILSLLTYQAMRFKSELLFWSPKLDESMSILRSPMASISTLENMIDVLSQMYEPFEVYQTGPRKGQYKLGKEVVDMVPAIRQIYRIKYAGTQVAWFMK